MSIPIIKLSNKLTINMKDFVDIFWNVEDVNLKHNYHLIQMIDGKNIKVFNDADKQILEDFFNNNNNGA